MNKYVLLGLMSCSALYADVGADTACAHSDNITPLMQAAYKGDESAVKELLHTDMARRQDRDGNTALIHAVLSGHNHIVELLAPIEGGITNGMKESALEIAAGSLNLGAVRALVQQESDHITRAQVALMNAAFIGSEKTWRKFEKIQSILKRYAEDTPKSSA